MSLNLRGSLLLRKNRDLQGSRAERGFLERTVSMSSSKTVPLVCPEAMMMSSVFWKGFEEGSIVGATPNCLWNRLKVLSSNNFASASDHMWTRLKNYRSQCCSDRRHNNLAFDVVNNELLTSCDAREVMRRGFEHMNGQCSKTLMQMDDTLSTDSVDNIETD